MEWIAGPAAVVTAGATLVLVVGTVLALRSPGRAGVVFASHTALALELLLAAGLLRLVALESLASVGAVAGIVVIRQVIARGIRSGAAAGRS